MGRPGARSGTAGPSTSRPVTRASRSTSTWMGPWPTHPSGSTASSWAAGPLRLQQLARGPDALCRAGQAQPARHPARQPARVCALVPRRWPLPPRVADQDRACADWPLGHGGAHARGLGREGAFGDGCHRHQPRCHGGARRWRPSSLRCPATAGLRVTPWPASALRPCPGARCRAGAEGRSHGAQAAPLGPGAATATASLPGRHPVRQGGQVVDRYETRFASAAFASDPSKACSSTGSTSASRASTTITTWARSAPPSTFARPSVSGVAAGRGRQRHPPVPQPART